MPTFVRPTCLPFLITASGTEIGKTFIAAGLARAWRDQGRAVAVLKPIMSGFDPADLGASDAGILLSAIGVLPTADAVAAISKFRFALPIAPDMAAAREGKTIDFTDLLQFCRGAEARATDLFLVEGAGGAMAPIGRDHTVRDLAKALNYKVIVVGGTYLGAISHALTAHAALSAFAVPIAAMVLSESIDGPVPPAEIRDTLQRHLPGTPVALVRRGAETQADLVRLASCLGAAEWR